jgi:drug/metabolite transporter (DMT)-like permease
MFSTAAFFTSFLEPLFFKRKIIFYEIILGLLVVVGVFLIFKSEFNYVNGIILGLFSALFASIFSVLNGVMIKNNSAITISFYEFTSGVAFISIYLFITKNMDSLLIENFLSLNYLYIFLLGSVCTAYAFIASVYLLKYITPYSVVLTYNLEPIYGIILALLFFGDNEKMSTQFYIGLFIILSSVLINMYVKKRSKQS